MQLQHVAAAIHTHKTTIFAISNFTESMIIKLTCFRKATDVWKGMILVIILSLALHSGYSVRVRGRQFASNGCEFHSRWTGTWFQKGVHPLIRIENDIFSFKGKCHDSNGDTYYIEDTKQECFRCVLIHEKHPNVLQYRETYCDVYKPLKEACASLSADASLYSLFRVDAQPVSCELNGPFTFTYSRGGRGDCHHPVSTVDSCTEDSKLLFRFQACADVSGTESSVEELSCLALWKEGPVQYLVGKMTQRKSHSPSFKDENAYRCFVFEYLPDKDQIQMSQNADATCDGLVSPLEGSRTMRLTKKSHPSSSCSFPSWVFGSHRWHTLDGRRSFTFKSTNMTMTETSSGQETKFTCINEMEGKKNSTKVIAHGIVGCESGYVCMKFYRRHKHIIELLMGTFSRSHQEACQSAFSEDDELVTITNFAETQKCPNLSETNGLTIQVGKFSSSPGIICGESLSTAVGCQIHDTLRFRVTCASYTDVKSFHCHGNWEENGRNYLVTTLKDTDHKYCFVYRGTESLTQVSGIQGVCQRKIEPGITGNFTFNISAAGDCDIGLMSQAGDLRSFHTLFIFYLLTAIFVLR